jgi:hypothetical protein
MVAIDEHNEHTEIFKHHKLFFNLSVDQPCAQILFYLTKILF